MNKIQERRESIIMALFPLLMRPFRRARIGSRIFNCFQIEVSSNCFLKCIMCPRTALDHQWKCMDMPFETFEKIGQYFTHTEWVYLSGWGEPLLNSRIFDMIRLAKDSGCSAGFTTNGMLLTEETCKRLIVSNLDVLSVSIAGATQKTHGQIRIGSDFERLTGNIRTLTSLKKAFNTEKPKVLLLYLMTRQNVDELPLAVKVAADLGANELVATNLTYVATPYHEQIKAFSFDVVSEEFVAKVGESEQTSKEVGLSFRSSPLKPEEALVCEEDPLNNIYVSCDGLVSPCVYLNPLMRDVPRIFCGNNYTLPRTYFGRIEEEDLFEIWNKEEYRSFRQKFEKRLELEGRILEFRFDLLEKIKEKIEASPLPEPCKTCYKAFSI